MVHAAFLMPLFPLVGFLVLLTVGRRVGDPLSGWIGTAAIGGAFVAACVTLAGLLDEPTAARHFTQTFFTWIPVGGLQVKAALYVDPLSMTMCMFVTGVSMLIHLYAIGYMKSDRDYSKFFVYFNLFVFSMLVLVLANNLLVTFVGWEGVGVCSYWLVSYWFQREAAASAGKKAFIYNRVGDVGFLLAMFLIFSKVGSLDYTVIFANKALLAGGTATAAVLLLFLAATGKSAQIPLFNWLPDAMEGPTPVSALIHAATMVTAGVYLLCRMSAILELSSTATWTIAIIGAATAFVAMTIATSQQDIKKVLAFSTVSQIGYMILAVGCGAYTAAIFLMVAHAFYKALLFLGAGSVIHGLEDEQDQFFWIGGDRLRPTHWLRIGRCTKPDGNLRVAGRRLPHGALRGDDGNSGEKNQSGKDGSAHRSSRLAEQPRVVRSVESDRSSAINQFHHEVHWNDCRIARISFELHSNCKGLTLDPCALDKWDILVDYADHVEVGLEGSPLNLQHNPATVAKVDGAVEDDRLPCGVGAGNYPFPEKRAIWVELGQLLKPERVRIPEDHSLVPDEYLIESLDYLRIGACDS